jgi:tetratricopeptide (TPR) repeat protein
VHVRPADFQGSKRFAVISKLGSGATGVVFAAEDRESGTRVALKVLRSLSPESVADFKAEFRAIADLDHPNLVRLGELIAEGDRWLFTMELVDGVDFYSYVRPDGVLDVDRLRSALLQLVAALEALHQSGQVHRDVKPSNVLVRDNGGVKLLDFGLVTGVDDESSLRGESTAVGTTAYVAPEQAAGRAVGPAADFYAMGVMLYEALTGRLPFEGPPLKILMDKQTQPAPPPSSIVPVIDADLDQLCIELLSADPALRPGTSRIIAKLRGRRTRAASQPTRSQEFFGRTAELDALFRVAQARGTRPAVRFVHGDSGVGKSALLARLGRRLSASGSLPLVSRCRERESVPYRALDGAFEELAHHLSRAPGSQVAQVLPRHAGLLGRTFPALSRVDAIAGAPLEDAAIENPLEQRRRAFAALRDLLHGLTRQKAVVLLIDDLHFADDDGLELLKLLCCAGDAPPITLIATLNPALGHTAGGSGRDASELTALLAPEAPPLVLGGLDLASATALASHLLEIDPPPRSPAPEEVASAAHCHPRLIEELVQHLKDHDHAGGEISVEDVVKSRTEALEASSLQLLGLLAIAAAPVPPEVLRKAAGLEPPELARELTGLKLARLVRSVGVRGKERVELYHDRIRDAALAQVPAAERVLHHRALALAYEVARSEDYEAMSRHFRAAGIPDRAADYAAKAADEALAALAFARAARLYQEAVELRGPGVAPELHARHGDALVNAGRGPEGARAFLAAAGERTTASAIDLRRRAAEQFMVSGHALEGLETARRVVSELGLPLSDSAGWGRVRATLRMLGVELRGLSFTHRDTSEISAMDLVRIDACWSLFVGLAAIEPMRVADPLSLHIALALKAGEPSRVGRGVAALGSMACMLRGQAQRAQELAERAESIAERLKQPHLSGLCQLNQGLRGYHAGDLEAAKASFEQAERTLSENCRSALWELGTTQFFLLMCHLHAGDVATLTRLSASIQDEASARGDLLTLANLRARVLPALALLHGEPERALELAEAKVTPDSGTATMSVQAYWRELSLIEHALYVGKPGRALARIRALFPTLLRSKLLSIRGVYLEAHWLRARAALGALVAGDESARAADVLRDAARIELGDMGGCAGLGLALRAGLAQRDGDRATAAAAWRGAEAQLRSDGRALLAQLARLRRGMLGDDAEAERARREAEVWLHGAGVTDCPAVLRVYMP